MASKLAYGRPDHSWGPGQGKDGIMSNPCRARAACLLLAFSCCLLRAQTGAPGKPAVNQDSLVIVGFEDLVKEYVKLHNKAKAGIPALKPTDSAHIINEHQRQLASKIRAARSEARPGDIFTPQISQLFKHLIGTTMQGPNAAKIRASLRHAEPVSQIPLHVNMVYPQQLPLQSSPPSVLLNLPPLPPELDYRIVWHTLVLRDVGANLIVDFIPDVIPSS